MKAVLPKDQPWLAVFWMMISVLCFTALGLFVKRVGVTVPRGELIFFRSFLNLALVFGLMLLKREKLYQGYALVLTVRGICGFIGIVALFYGIGHLPLGIASLLSFSSPLFVFLVSPILLKEPLHGLDWFVI